MTPLSEETCDAYIDELTRWADRIEFNELVARELVRSQSLTATRTSLLRSLEFDRKARRWHLIGNRVPRFWEIFDRVIDAEQKAEARVEIYDPRQERSRKIRPVPLDGPTRGYTRTEPLGIKHATLESWIKNLRSDGFLKPSTGPGRPRRDTPKYELGPHRNLFM